MSKDPNKPARVKLQLTDATARAEAIAAAQKHGRSYEYDVKKVMATLNCNHSQATTVIALAQIADASQPAGKAAGR